MLTKGIDGWQPAILDKNSILVTIGIEENKKSSYDMPVKFHYSPSVDQIQFIEAWDEETQQYLMISPESHGNIGAFNHEISALAAIVKDVLNYWE